MLAHVETLRRLGACDGPNGAIIWAAQYPDAQSAWSACPRGDWMAWLVGRVAQGTPQGSPERCRATLIAVLCARTVTHLAGDHAPEIERLLSRVEVWARGDDEVDLCAVRDRLWSIRAYAAYAAATANAYAAYAAATANAYAAYAAYANAAADWHRAREAHLRDLADLIRNAIPTPPEVP